jgi:hypothetical protein
MHHLILSLILITQSANIFPCSQAVTDRIWRNGTYRGLTVGKSTRADMLRVLGKPLSSVPTEGQDPPYPIIWHDYGRITGDVAGTLAVEVDKRNNRIVSISISPENMTRKEVIGLFGNDYLPMGYEFCKGTPLDADSGPIYESPKSSQIDYLEYRSKGIAVHFNYQGIVNAVYYVDGPIGLPSEAHCKKAIDDDKRKSKRRVN